MFAGFSPVDFDELSNLDSEAKIRRAFRYRIDAFIDALNALPVGRTIVPMIQARYPGAKGMFPKDRGRTIRYIHGSPGHWYIFNRGGRWEPQFNIGMHARRARYLRVGIGQNFTLEGDDPKREQGQLETIAYFKRFQSLLRRDSFLSAFIDWASSQHARLEHVEGHRPPNQRWFLPDKIQDPLNIVEWVAAADPWNEAWVFWGRLLDPNNDEDRRVLADPDELLRTIDAVFSPLIPLWQQTLNPALQSNSLKGSSP